MPPTIELEDDGLVTIKIGEKSADFPVYETRAVLVSEDHYIPKAKAMLGPHFGQVSDRLAEKFAQAIITAFAEIAKKNAAWVESLSTSPEPPASTDSPFTDSDQVPSSPMSP